MGLMRNFRLFLSSKKGQITFNLLYSWGAAVVIAGAMCKIMHFKGGDQILMAGMIIEVLVFIAAGFDYSTTNATETENSGVAVGGGFLGGSAVGGGSDATITTSRKDKESKVGGSGSVVVIGGGSSGGGSYAGSPVNSGSVQVTGNNTQNMATSGGTTQSSTVSGGVPSGSMSPEYSASLNNTAQNLDDFSKTIHSLNEVSQKLLGAYQDITETQGFADNLVTLNKNVSGLNEVFDSQLQTITEQMSAIRYINDSLQRMKSLYDGAIGDSYMFREESAKMTKHIEALNNVYARLLQAMTTNNNNNMNHSNF